MRVVFFVVAVGSVLLIGCSDDDGDKDTGPGMEAGTKEASVEGGMKEGGIDLPAASKTCRSWCDNAADCPAPTFKDCVNNRCVTCAADTDCDASVFKGGCNTTTGMCQSCKDDTHCDAAGTPIQTGKCDTSTGTCNKCNVDADCAYIGTIYTVCLKGVCAQCSADTDCVGALTKCDTATGVCGCSSDDECCTSAGGSAGCGLTCNAGTCECPDDATCDTVYSATGLKYKCK